MKNFKLDFNSLSVKELNDVEIIEINGGEPPIRFQDDCYKYGGEAIRNAASYVAGFAVGFVKGLFNL